MAKKNEKQSKNTIVRINDRYRLVYDKYCMWIEEYIPTTKKGEPRKEPWVQVSGYHRTVTELVQSLEWRAFLRIEDAEEIHELMQAQAQMHDEIRELCEGLKTVKQLSK